MRPFLILLAATASAQIVPPPGASLLHVDAGAGHSFAELVTNVAPGLAAGAQSNVYASGAGEPDLSGVTAVVSHLAWRRNTQESQSNLYVSAGLGVLRLEGADAAPGMSAAFQLDWETRRLHAALIGHSLIGEGVAQGELMVHLGFAPWTASYEEVAPWILLEVSRVVGREGEVEVAPMLVLMYQAYRLEAGVDGDGHPRAAIRWIF